MRIETEQPDWVKKHLIRLEEFEYEGNVYSYAVLDHKVATKNNGPKIFTVYSGGVIACSDTYPSEFRKFGLIHEIVEYTTGEKGSNEHDCQRATEAELALFGETNFGVDMLEYVEFRIEFFEDMILFYDTKKQQEGDELMVRKLRNSLGYLNYVKSDTLL